MIVRVGRDNLIAFDEAFANDELECCLLQACFWNDVMHSIDALLTRMNELSENFPLDLRPVFHSGVTEDTISNLQKSVGAQLPSEFAYFLSRCDSIIAMDIWNGYWIGGCDQLLRSIARKDFPPEVREGSNLTSIVQVATNGGSNAFLLSLDGNKVWKWDHETSGTTLVTYGFSSFLARIVEDWEHFLADDQEWRYISG